MTKRDPLIEAAQRFVDVGGRLTLSPRGRFVSVINSDLVIVPTPSAEARLQVAAALRQARMAPGSTRRLKYIIARHGRRADGWRVIGG